MTLFGYGKTNQSIAKKFGNCDIFDDKFEELIVDEFGNRLMPPSMFDPSKSNIEITSPGIPPSNSLIKNARNLISEYDFFSNSMPLSIWISGTNGKTTTTQMIHHLFANRDVDCGGNIGKPLADMNPHSRLWILETSSFTLHYTKIAKPNLYILLPITPDHLSWHETMEEYENSKLKPIYKLNEGEIAIVPKKYRDIETNGYLITYNSYSDLAEYFQIDISKLKFKGVFLLDAVLALATTKILSDTIDYELMNSFVIDAHKQEELFDYRGRLWIDDSKATNIDATIELLKLYEDKKIYLILGGDDKGVDMSILFEYLQNLDIEIFAIGSNSDRLVQYSLQYAIDITKCEYLDLAVSKIDILHNDETVAILSPAAASLDQFSGYKERGEKFKEYVMRIT
jgi:UDP-N-acetylmuramoylalanine--D-glutamate ligase